jgi:hypothetical protein
MGFPTSEVGYTSTTTGRGDHEVHKGHVVTLEEKLIYIFKIFFYINMSVFNHAHYRYGCE